MINFKVVNNKLFLDKDCFGLVGCLVLVMAVMV